MSEGKRNASKFKNSSIFSDMEYPDESRRGTGIKKSGGDGEYEKIVKAGKGSSVFKTSEGLRDTRNDKIEGASPKSTLKDAPRTDAENALYAANLESRKAASEARILARSHANATSADGVLYDKEHEKMTFETESMRQLEISNQASETGKTARTGRKQIAAKGKGSSIFSSAAENILTRGIKTNIKNEPNRAPRQEVNEENAAISEQVKKDRLAQRQRGYASEVFGGGAYEGESAGTDQKVTDRPMQGGFKPAEQAVDQNANKAKRQALLAGSGALW